MLEGSILQKLNKAHQGSQRPLNLGIYYKNTLVALCHALEDFILDTNSAPIMVTAFQRGKWYLEEAERYSDLADKADRVVIMAAPDGGFESHPTSQKENVNIINLKLEDPVAEEWHLMILSPTYTAMVLCQELSPKDYGAGNQPKTDLERKFYGFWTFEPELVRETVNLAIAHVGTYNPSLAKSLATKVNEMTANFGSKQRNDLDAVVSQVVGYLQASQKNLHHPDKSDTFSGFQDLDANIVSSEMQAFLRMAQLLDLTDLGNPMAASEVAAMAEAMGQLTDLPAWQTKRLYLAGLLHRVGLPKLKNRQSPTQKELLENSDSLPNASVLRVMPQLEAISKILTHQRECWDGSGLPSGLSYDNIPVESRIIGLLADFQQKVKAYKQYGNCQNPLSQALEDCQNLAGTRYDPKLVEALALLVMGMQQGMTLQNYQPKISAGIWLLDTERVGKNPTTSY